MRPEKPLPAGFEPERYELDERSAYRFDLPRRDFVKTFGSGLAVLFLLPSGQGQESGRGRGRRPGGNTPGDLGSWLHIAEDGQVTVYTGKAEVGQNIRTSLTQAVAEELRTTPERIRLVMADTQLTPYDAGTFGSRTTPDMARQLRKVAAAAREVLMDLAAQSWSIPRDKVVVRGHRLLEKDGNRALDFGAVTKGQKLTQTVQDNAPTNPPADWQVAGQSASKVNGKDFVTGRHRYASDVTAPGLVHGKVLRPPAFGAALASVDLAEVQSLPGVSVVHDGNFVGVTAATESAAAAALKRVKANWTFTPQVADEQLFQHLKDSSSASGSAGGRGGGNRSGSIEQGLESADTRLKASYQISYIAHVPLEPRAAVAQWENEQLTVWTGTQRPFGVRGELAEALRVPEERIRVIVPDTGSGYGGKHTGEAAVEAARLARSAGKPVKLVWTREEEFTWAYFRPAGVIEVSSGVHKDGTLTAWEFHNYNSGGSSIRTLYEVPNQVIEFHQARSPLRQGSYRALAATANVFARETHMDELAQLLGMDALEFRLKNLKEPRLRAVLEAAAKAFGWGRKAPAGRGFGIGAGSEKGSYVASCAEVAANPSTGEVKVIRAVSAFECGAVLNPDHLKNQVEGALVMGLGGALLEAIRFKEGKILNPRFSAYHVPRFRDTPEIEVVLLDRKDLPSAGAGETPIIGIAPAVGNAIFAATGRRLRSLPLNLKERV